MKPKWLLSLLVIAAGSLLYWYYSRPEPIPVRMYRVQLGRVEATVANTRAGTVKACRRSHLAPAVGGQVAKLNVKEGDRVKAGQVLMEIWNEDLDAALKLASSEAKAARAKADEACVRAELAQKEAGRQLKLKDLDLIAEEQVERAVADAKSAAAACRSARATIRSSEARVDERRAALDRTILRAPFDGVVAEVNAELGEFSTPSPPGIPTAPALDVIDDRCIYVSAPIDEVDAPAVRVGMRAYVTLDAFPDREFPGRMRRIAPYVLEREKQARTVEVEVELDPSDDLHGLLEGYSADVEIVLSMREHVLRVPTEAVLDGSRVLIYRPVDQRLEERTFKPGLSNWAFTEILSGIERGERVVASLGREGVEPGAYVMPESPDGAKDRSNAE